MLFIQAKRRLNASMRDYRLTSEGEAALLRLLGEYKPANWWELQARIAHYGSDEVMAEFKESHDADDQVAVRLVQLAALNRRATEAAESGNRAAAPDMKEINAGRKELSDAQRRADEIDQALIKRMRAELRGDQPLGKSDSAAV